MSYVNEIVRQLHFTKPDALRPGADVGMQPLPDGVSVGIFIRPAMRVAVVLYLEGADEYVVATADVPDEFTFFSEQQRERHLEREFIRLHRACKGGDEDGVTVVERPGPDGMTRIVWGDEAKDFEAELGPMVIITDEDGNPL